VQEHKDLIQLRSADERGRDQGGGDAVREKDQRFRKAVRGKPGHDGAIAGITRAASVLLEKLVTTAPPKNREAEAVKAHARALQRFGARGSRRR